MKKESEKEVKTLFDFYENLPKATSPKTEFIRKVAERCDLEEGTVRLWVKDKTKPKDPKHLEILSEETNIPVNKLFEQ